jgi:flagellar protein FlaE
MSINPRDYDLDELRKMARERGGDTSDRADPGDTSPDIGGIGSMGPDEGSASARDSFRAGLYRELLPLEAGGEATKPYLHHLPETYAGEHLIFEWLEFLLLHAGYQGSLEAIDYYESVDWITEECESQLNEYMLGLDDRSGSEPANLDVDDHLLSLVYIAKLSSM